MESESAGRKAANRMFWDRAAGRWRDLDPIPPAALTSLTTQLACAPGSLLLDAGCGTGRWSMPLAQAGYRVRGVDLAPAMVEAAHAAGAAGGLVPGMAGFLVGDLEHLPFRAGMFDGILCRNALDFVPAPAVALAEFARVLLPGGRLVVSTLGAYSPVTRESWRRFLPDNRLPTLGNQLLPWELEALLAALGWQILAQEPHFGPAVSGATNAYTPDAAARLADRVLQQTVATSWTMVAFRPAGAAGIATAR